jgi:NAD-dependent deacetylase
MSASPLERPVLDERTSVLVLTGAGISAESGVPTFRGIGGLWEGKDVTRLASPEGFDEDPQQVWRFYSERREKRRAVHPNPGHHALVKLEGLLGDRFLLATQNVDGLHREAGSRRMVSIHGELMETKCERCLRPFADDKTYAEVPKCPDCGARLRPNVVWFGEMLDPSHLERVSRFIEDAKQLVFFAVGTSGAVWPAAGFVDAVRRRRGQTWLVDLQPSDDYAARFDVVLAGKSGELLPQLW